MSDGQQHICAGGGGACAWCLAAYASAIAMAQHTSPVGVEIQACKDVLVSASCSKQVLGPGFFLGRMGCHIWMLSLQNGYLTPSIAAQDQDASTCSEGFNQTGQGCQQHHPNPPTSRCCVWSTNTNVWLMPCNTHTYQHFFCSQQRLCTLQTSNGGAEPRSFTRYCCS
jgi:hypothetical protein